jgi:arylsulfatase A-like enzyme
MAAMAASVAGGQRRWRRAALDIPPSAAEAAVATLLAGAALALGNLVDIAIGVPWPAAGLRLRLLHHLFDALESLGLGAWLAAPWALAAYVGRGPRWMGWAAYGLGAAWAVGWLAEHELRRQAYVMFGGRFDDAIYLAELAVCGLALCSAYAVGAFLGRLGWPRPVALVAASAAVAALHLAVRDDPYELQTAALWGACVLVGAILAPALWRSMSARATRRLVIVAAGLALVALAIAPPNAVRLELLRQPGAAASLLLARTRWRAPELPQAAAPGVAALERGLWNEARRGVPDHPIVVLITVDALRADVVTSGRYDAELPNLTKLRDTGASFSRATAPGSQTSVSLSSLFTSRYFSQLEWRLHGVGPSRFHYPASDATLRFPALLKAAGIDTESSLPLLFLRDDYGIARGFAREHVHVGGREHAHAARVVAPLLARLAEPAPQGLFWYGHLMEPHEPYNRGRVRAAGHEDAWQGYLAEIELVDGWLGRVVAALAKAAPNRGYLIVSSDHGEAFGEHGTRFHSKTLYEELLAVPLLVWGPGIEPRRIDARVSLVDVGPTVLHLFGRDADPGAMGLSLLPLARGLLPELSRPVFAEARMRRAFYAANHLKVIEDLRSKTVEVYDLGRDPGETVNLFDTASPEVLAAVAAQRAFFAAHALELPGYELPFKR